MDSAPSSSRPYTAGGRPSTANPSSVPPTASDEDSNYFANSEPPFTPYSQDYSIDEEEEESEAEDVFAFGPPSTADAAQQPSTPVSPLSPSVSFPERAFDPNAPRPPPNAAEPSSLHTRHPYPASPQVESPPSTDSNPTDDPYRLQRLMHSPNTDSVPNTTSRTTRTGTVQTQSGTGRSARSSAVSSREVHISLPRARERIEEEQLDDPQKSRPPSSATSFPSLDSGGVASMKCVFLLVVSLRARFLPRATAIDRSSQAARARTGAKPSWLGLANQSPTVHAVSCIANRPCLQDGVRLRCDRGGRQPFPRGQGVGVEH